MFTVTQPFGCFESPGDSRRRELKGIRISRVRKVFFGIQRITDMKNIGKILLFVFFILCMFLLKPRQDVVLEAIDTTQYIRLFEEDRDFVLGIDANSIYSGTYTLVADTVYLNYREQLKTSLAAMSGSPKTNKLPEKLYINESSSFIESKEGHHFSAEISLDKRHRDHEDHVGLAFVPDREMDQRARIFVLAGLK